MVLSVPNVATSLSRGVWNLVDHLSHPNEVLLLLTHVRFRLVSHARLGPLVTKY